MITLKDNSYVRNGKIFKYRVTSVLSKLFNTFDALKISGYCAKKPKKKIYSDIKQKVQQEGGHDIIAETAKRIRLYWDKLKNDACTKGTHFHMIAEKLFLGLHVPPSHERDLLLNFFNMMITKGYTPWLSEFTVGMFQPFSVLGTKFDGGVAGTIDAIWISKDETSYIIVDYKRSKKTPSSTYWDKQLAIYYALINQTETPLKLMRPTRGVFALKDMVCEDCIIVQFNPQDEKVLKIHSFNPVNTLTAIKYTIL